MTDRFFIDSPVSFALGIAAILLALWSIRHYFRGRSGRGRLRLVLGFMLRSLLLLAGIVLVADGTNKADVNVCIELTEGLEFCNHPESAESPDTIGDTLDEDIRSPEPGANRD